MFKRILILTCLLLFSFNSFAADGEKHSSMNPLKAALDVRDSTASHTQEEMVAAGWWPFIEAQIGCANTQRVRGFPWISGEYKCVGKNNNFNSEANRPLNVGNDFMFNIYYCVGFLIVALLGFVTINMLSSGHENDKQEKKSWAVSFVMLTVFLSIICYPRFENDDGVKNTSMVTISWIAILSLATESDTMYMGNVKASATLENPLIAIPSPNNQKTNQIYDAVRFFAANSDNVNLGSGNRNGTIKVSYDYGQYSAFTQKGSYFLSIDTSINPELLIKAKAAGVDYQALVNEWYKKALTRAMTDAQGVANKVISKSASIANPVAFNKDSFSCDNMSGYNVNALSNEGLADYAYEASECISKNLMSDLNKYPGIDESFYGSKLKGRLVHLCEQDTFVGDGKEMDTTNKLLEKGGTYQSLKEKLGQCVSKMCTASSSPYVCGAAIEYYDKMAGNRHITDPSLLTIPAYFLSTEYQSDKFVNGAKDFTNKFTVTFGRASTILDDDLDKETVFTIPYSVGERGQGISKDADSILDNSPVITASSKDVFTSLLKFFDIGDDGMFGALYTFDCLAYPEQISPSGRNCSTVFTTFKMQGTRFIVAGIQIQVGSKLAKQGRRTTADKMAETAAVEATKSVLKNVNVMDTGVVISKIIGLGALDAAVDDAYSEYGTKLGPMATYAAALAYSVPSIVGFLDTVGGMLQSIGYFMSYAHQLTIIGIALAVVITMIGMFVYFNYAFMLYFIILMSRNQGVNPTTDWYKTFDVLTKYFYSIVAYPPVFVLSFLFVKAVFFLQVINVDSMLNVNSGIEPYSDSIASLPSTLAMMSIKMLIYFIVIAVIIKNTTKTPAIVSANIFGNMDDGVEDDDFEIQMKKLGL